MTHLMATTTLGIFSLVPTFCFSSTSINTKRLSCITSTTARRKNRSFPYEIGHIGQPPSISAVRATSGPNSSETSSSPNTQNSAPPPLEDDLTYLLKLAAGSVLGAAVIKYGSAIIPDITRPNITQALLMISTPAVIAVLLLSNGSRKE